MSANKARNSGLDEFLKHVAEMVDKAEKMLYEYPLCDSCLGRFFSKYGLGLSNWERGRTLKTLLAMKLYEDYISGKASEERLRRLGVNANAGVLSMYTKLFGLAGATPRECYVCRNAYTRDLILKIANDVCSKISEYGAKSFLIGVALDKEIASRELELATKYGLSAAESIKREIKREVGKAAKELCNIEPDFANPDVVAIINLNADFTYSVRIEASPILLKGVYWKLGRRVSHVPWYTKAGTRKYPLSIQESIEAALKDVFKAKEVVIHAAGREDVDARMVGTGRPLVIEVKEPKERLLDIEYLNTVLAEKLASSPVKAQVTSPSTRKDVRLLKELSKKKRKAYRLLVYSPHAPISRDEVARLEEFFRDVVIRQLTPQRVLRRKKERERRRRVHALKVLQITPRLVEVLIYCDGGLYVKELVHCDEGRTSPCLAELLNKVLVPLEIDVVKVEE
ncbi:MAG: tRNA pseudouridine(54/55) synthase Pus10 [Desulfurococcaceae archaeon]